MDFINSLHGQAVFVAPANAEQIGFYHAQFSDVVERQFGGMTKLIATAQRSSALLTQVGELQEKIIRLEGELEMAKCKPKADPKPIPKPAPAKPKAKGGKK